MHSPSQAHMHVCSKDYTPAAQGRHEQTQD